VELKNKTALITGGGTGLGRAVTLKLAKEGMNVAIIYSRSKDDAEKTARDAEAFGIKAITVKADVSVPGEAENMVTEVVKVFGRLDLLVNNAGTTKVVPFKDLDGLNEEDWLRLYKTNTVSTFIASRAAAKVMRKTGGGHIINTVSIAGIRPSGSSIAYAVSKAAQIHTTKCLAVALAPDIKVNGVAPGLLLTRWADGFSGEQIEIIKNSTLLKKTADVEDCAAMYINLAKNDSMTGQIIIIDAGQVV
jgi:3-oxoacyl-[acyl-carrier protein] reductase